MKNMNVYVLFIIIIKSFQETKTNNNCFLTNKC